MKVESERKVEEYLDLLQQLRAARAEMRTVVSLPRHCLPFLQPGRLVRVLPAADGGFSINPCPGTCSFQPHLSFSDACLSKYPVCHGSPPSPPHSLLPPPDLPLNLPFSPFYLPSRPFHLLSCTPHTPNALFARPAIFWDFRVLLGFSNFGCNN